MRYTILAILVAVGFTSCQKIGLKEFTGDTSYLAFKKEIKDSILVSFLYFTDDEIAFPIEMQLAGAMLTEDKEYKLSVVKDSTTLNAKNYDLPERFVFRAGRASDTAYITFKNSEELASNVFKFMLQVEDNENFTAGALINRRARLLVTDKLSQPTWWVDDGQNPVWYYYLGKYSEKKYRLLLEVSEGMNFEGATAVVLREYALKLKKYVEDYNTAHPGKPLMDEENNEPMTIPVAG